MSYFIQLFIDLLLILTHLLISNVPSNEKCNDLTKKKELDAYFKSTRIQFARLSFLIRWTAKMEGLERAKNLLNFVQKQDDYFVEAADTLYNLREFQRLNVPIFAIPTAIDVLNSGTYHRLPSILEKPYYVLQQRPPPHKLSDSDKEALLAKFDQIIRIKLMWEKIPFQFQVPIVKDGLVQFIIENEFCATLTLYDGIQPNDPWCLVKLEIFVQVFQGTEDVVNPVHLEDLKSFVQIAMNKSKEPLYELYNIVHTFCQVLQLNLLYIQAKKYEANNILGYEVGNYLSLSLSKDNPISIFISIVPRLPTPPKLKKVTIRGVSKAAEQSRKKTYLIIETSPPLIDPNTGDYAQIYLNPRALDINSIVAKIRDLHNYNTCKKLVENLQNYLKNGERKTEVYYNEVLFKSFSDNSENKSMFPSFGELHPGSTRTSSLKSREDLYKLIRPKSYPNPNTKSGDKNLESDLDNESFINISEFPHQYTHILGLSPNDIRLIVNQDITNFIIKIRLFDSYFITLHFDSNVDKLNIKYCPGISEFQKKKWTADLQVNYNSPKILKTLIEIQIHAVLYGFSRIAKSLGLESYIPPMEYRPKDFNLFFGYNVLIVKNTPKFQNKSVILSIKQSKGYYFPLLLRFYISNFDSINEFDSKVFPVMINTENPMECKFLKRFFAHKGGLKVFPTQENNESSSNFESKRRAIAKQPLEIEESDSDERNDMLGRENIMKNGNPDDEDGGTIAVVMDNDDNTATKDIIDSNFISSGFQSIFGSCNIFDSMEDCDKDEQNDFSDGDELNLEYYFMLDWIVSSSALICQDILFSSKNISLFKTNSINYHNKSWCYDNIQCVNENCDSYCIYNLLLDPILYRSVQLNIYLDHWTVMITEFGFDIYENCEVESRYELIYEDGVSRKLVKLQKTKDRIVKHIPGKGWYFKYSMNSNLDVFFDDLKTLREIMSKVLNFKKIISSLEEYKLLNKSLSDKKNNLINILINNNDNSDLLNENGFFSSNTKASLSTYENILEKFGFDPSFVKLVSFSSDSFKLLYGFSLENLVQVYRFPRSSLSPTVSIYSLQTLWKFNFEPYENPHKNFAELEFEYQNIPYLLNFLWNTYTPAKVIHHLQNSLPRRWYIVLIPQSSYKGVLVITCRSSSGSRFDVNFKCEIRYPGARLISLEETKIEIRIQKEDQSKKELTENESKLWEQHIQVLASYLSKNKISSENYIIDSEIFERYFDECEIGGDNICNNNNNNSSNKKFNSNTSLSNESNINDFFKASSFTVFHQDYLQILLQNLICSLNSRYIFGTINRLNHGQLVSYNVIRLNSYPEYQVEFHFSEKSLRLILYIQNQPGAATQLAEDEIEMILNLFYEKILKNAQADHLESFCQLLTLPSTHLKEFVSMLRFIQNCQQPIDINFIPQQSHVNNEHDASDCTISLCFIFQIGKIKTELKIVFSYQTLKWSSKDDSTKYILEACDLSSKSISLVGGLSQIYSYLKQKIMPTKN